MFNFIIEWYVDIDTAQQLVHGTTLRYSAFERDYYRITLMTYYCSMIFYWNRMFDRKITRHAMVMAQHTNIAFTPV